jgi:hypothetical protein
MFVFLLTADDDGMLTSLLTVLVREIYGSTHPDHWRSAVGPIRATGPYGW